MEVLRARDIMARDQVGKHQGPSSRPFAKVLLVTARGTALPKQGGRTATLPWTLTPEWDEAFTLGGSLAGTRVLHEASVECRLLHDDVPEAKQAAAAATAERNGDPPPAKSKGIPLGATEPFPLRALAEEPGMAMVHWFELKPIKAGGPPGGEVKLRLRLIGNCAAIRAALGLPELAPESKAGGVTLEADAGAADGAAVAATAESLAAEGARAHAEANQEALSAKAAADAAKAAAAASAAAKEAKANELRRRMTDRGMRPEIYGILKALAPPPGASGNQNYEDGPATAGIGKGKGNNSQQPRKRPAKGSAPAPGSTLADAWAMLGMTTEGTQAPTSWFAGPEVTTAPLPPLRTQASPSLLSPASPPFASSASPPASPPAALSYQEVPATAATAAAAASSRISAKELNPQVLLTLGRLTRASVERDQAERAATEARAATRAAAEAAKLRAATAPRSVAQVLLDTAPARKAPSTQPAELSPLAKVILVPVTEAKWRREVGPWFRHWRQGWERGFAGRFPRSKPAALEREATALEEANRAAKASAVKAAETAATVAAEALARASVLAVESANKDAAARASARAEAAAVAAAAAAEAAAAPWVEARAHDKWRFVVRADASALQRMLSVGWRVNRARKWRSAATALRAQAALDAQRSEAMAAAEEAAAAAAAAAEATRREGASRVVQSAWARWRRGVCAVRVALRGRLVTDLQALLNTTREAAHAAALAAPPRILNTSSGAASARGEAAAVASTGGMGRLAALDAAGPFLTPLARLVRPLVDPLLLPLKQAERRRRVAANAQAESRALRDAGFVPPDEELAAVAEASPATAAGGRGGSGGGSGGSGGSDCRPGTSPKKKREKRGWWGRKREKQKVEAAVDATPAQLMREATATATTDLVSSCGALLDLAKAIRAQQRAALPKPKRKRRSRRARSGGGRGGGRSAGGGRSTVGDFPPMTGGGGGGGGRGGG